MQTLDKSLTRMRFSERAADIYNAKRLGVALGPGLPAGLVDLGMLIALQQLRIPVKMISGTSMGAVIGALYASGKSPEEVRDGLIEFFANGTLQKLLKLDQRIPWLGFSSAEKLMEEIIKFTGWDPEFYELRVPLCVVAADRVSQESVILRYGRVFEAVRESLAMPLVVNEKQLGGMKLSDGAIFAPLDTQVLYAEGADFVIAIHAKLIRGEHRRTAPFRSKIEPYLLKALGWNVKPEIYFSKPACDILLRPRVPQTLLADGNLANKIIDIGIRITYEAIHEIEKGNIPKSSFPSVSISGKQKVATQADVEIGEEIGDLQSYIMQLEQKAAMMSDAELTKEFPQFARRFQAFLGELTSRYPDPAEAREVLKDKIKGIAHVIDHSPFMNRCLRKPLGYAGDYQMMNYLYDDEVFAASSNMGKLLNYFLFSSPSANAVRNRAKVVQGFIQYHLGQKRNLAVASIASGPAREIAGIVRVLNDLGEGAKIIWTLFDQDKEALDNARKNVPHHASLEYSFKNHGVKDLLQNRVNLGPQDIIYSLGLFDYLEDKVATSLIKRLYAEVIPGGLLLIGNYHPSNPLRALMEGTLEWYLIHHTEEEMLALAKGGAPEGRHIVMAEPEGVNLILVTSKPV